MVNTVTLMAVVVMPVLAQATPAAPLSSIQIKATPSMTLLAGQELQLAATGTYSDGTTADITSQVAWSISNNKAAKISPSGLVSVVESGGGFGLPAMPGRSGGAMGPGGAPGSGGPGMMGPGTPPDGGRGPGGPGGAGGPMGGPGSGGLPAAVTVSVTASLSGVAGPALSLTVKTTEGPAVYSQSGGTAAKLNQTITTSDKATSGVKVTDGGTLTLSDSQVTTSGNTTGMEDSSFYGLDAGVLAMGGSRITMTNGSIATRGTGANGAFAVRRRFGRRVVEGQD